MVNERCLVTGGCGGLGRELARQLARGGRLVRVLDIREPERPLPRVEYHRGDVRNYHDAETACTGMNAVFHLASVPPDAGGDTIRTVNIDGTAAVVEAAATCGVDSLVFASCSSVYGYPPPEWPCSESVNTVSTGPFTLSKIVGEEMCFEAANAGMHAVAIRAPIIFGPGACSEFVMKWIVKRALDNQPVFLPGGGGMKRHYVDVAECAAAFIRAADTDSANGHAINVGYPQAHKDEQLAKAIIRFAHSFSVILPIPMRLFETGLNFIETIDSSRQMPEEEKCALLNESCYNTEKAGKVLGWRSKKTLSVTVHEFLQWLKRKGMG